MNFMKITASDHSKRILPPFNCVVEHSAEFFWLHALDAFQMFEEVIATGGKISTVKIGTTSFFLGKLHRHWAGVHPGSQWILPKISDNPGLLVQKLQNIWVVEELLQYF